MQQVVRRLDVGELPGKVKEPEEGGRIGSPAGRASLKLQDYNPKRDFVRWGVPVDYEPIMGMPGFTHRVAMPRVDPEAVAISSTCLRGDGKPDLCLIGAELEFVRIGRATV